MKRYRKDRNITLLLLAIVIIAYLLKHTVLMDMGIIYGGITLLVLIIATFIGLVLPQISRKGFMEFDGWMLVVFILLLVLAILVILQMTVQLYSQAFYSYGFDALAAIAICLALWQNHINFVHTNRERSRKGSAVLWTGLSFITVKGFLIAYRDKKKKK